MWDDTGTPELHYARRKTLNSAHILTSPARNWINPQSLTLITNIPHCSTIPHCITCLLLSESPVCWLYLGKIASEQVLSVELCGFLRSSEHGGGSTPAQQTIAVASIDSAGLWSGNGCNLNTSGSMISACGLCEERQLWHETTKAFKNVQVFGWSAIFTSDKVFTWEKLQGCLKGVHASVLIYCGPICQIFIAQLIGIGSSIKTETLKIYMLERDKSWKKSQELQYVWIGKRKTPHRQNFTFHIWYLFLQSEVLARCLN